jgi:hypothetical protein
MREIRPFGSEPGAKLFFVPTPIKSPDTAAITQNPRKSGASDFLNPQKSRQSESGWPPASVHSEQSFPHLEVRDHTEQGVRRS